MLDDFPKLYVRRSDADLRLCQLNTLTGEAIADDHHRNLTPDQLRRRFINGLNLYSKYSSPILGYESEAGMSLMEHHIIQQCLPALNTKEISTHDIENIWWFMNEYKQAGNDYIALRRLYFFIHEIQDVKIVRLLNGISWAKIVPILIRAMVFAARDHDVFLKKSLRRVLMQREEQRMRQRYEHNR